MDKERWLLVADIVIIVVLLYTLAKLGGHMDGYYGSR